MSLLKQICIGGLTTENNVFLAPMAGIGDSGFRIIGKTFGVGLTFTEMVSAHGLLSGNEKSINLLKLSRKERPGGIQLFGSNPEVMSRAVSICGDFQADLIDINGGCSVNKVMKTGAGAMILDDPEKFYRLVKSCVDASCYPVSVKVRLGISEDRIKVLENAIAAQEAGASMFTLHPRTAKQRYSGKARWEYIGLVKQALHIPVCGNGDINSPFDAIHMIQETGCDAVMIGRGAIGNPWLIRNTIFALRSYPDIPSFSEVTTCERIECALKHLELVVSFKSENRGMKEIKRHLYRYLRGVPGVSQIREEIMHMDTKQEVVEKLSTILQPE